METQEQTKLDTINRRFCKMSFEGKDLLCIPNGYFAGDAFVNGKDKHYVIGSSFGIIAGDDNIPYKQDKHTISEVSDDEILTLLEQDRLSKQFVREAKELLKLEPIRPISNW